jgi:hypothetical protein
MELRITDLTKPQKVEIQHNGQSFTPPAFVSVMAFDSKEGARVKANLIREILKLRQSTDEAPAPEVFEALTVDALVSLVTGWEGFKDEKGKALKFTPENARTVFTNYPFIFEQVNNFCGNLGNYIKA